MQQATQQQSSDTVVLGPPETIDAATLAFCATISAHTPFYVPVVPGAEARPAYCFDNSVAQAAANGGEATYGWAIWRWPGRWFEAEHHAVWRRPDGSFLDVTPQPGDPERILFLPQPEAVFDPERYRRNVMAPDGGNALAAEYIALAGKRNDVTDRYWYPGIEAFPLFSPEDQAEIAPIDARMAELRRQMIASPPGAAPRGFAEMVCEAGHPLNPAWQALTGENITGEKARSHDIRYLLRLVRRRYPELEGQFEEERVLRWERRGTITLWIAAAAAVALLLVAGLLLYFLGNRLPPAAERGAPPVSLSPVNTALTNQRVDTDRALEMLLGDDLNIVDIENNNPALVQSLQRIWNQAHERGAGSDAFFAAVAAEIDAHYSAAVRAAPAPLLIEYFGIMRDTAVALRASSAADCASFADGGDFDGSAIPQTIAERHRKLAAQVLGQPAAVPQSALAGFRLPPAIEQGAAARASLTPPVFGEALRGRGRPEDRCGATIALWEAVLELPPAEAAPLLRRL